MCSNWKYSDNILWKNFEKRLLDVNGLLINQNISNVHAHTDYLISFWNSVSKISVINNGENEYKLSPTKNRSKLIIGNLNLCKHPILISLFNTCSLFHMNNVSRKYCYLFTVYKFFYFWRTWEHFDSCK